MSVHVNDSGTWRNIQEIYVKDSGIWRQIYTETINDSGTWRSVYPDLNRLYTAGKVETLGRPSSSSTFSLFYSNPNLVSSYANTPTLNSPNDWLSAEVRGGASVVAVSDYGDLWSWGSTTYGELGREDSDSYYDPTEPYGGGTWKTPPVEDNYRKSFAIGDIHAAAIKNDGTLWTWGGAPGTGVYYPSFVQLSVRRLPYPEPGTPVTTSAGGTNWKKITSAGQTNLAIKTDGTLWGWGLTLSFNIFGTNAGGEENSLVTTPTEVWPGSGSWKDISLYAISSYQHPSGFRANGIKTDGTLWSWGYSGADGYFYAGGTGLNVVSTPIEVYGGGSWESVETGPGMTMAIKTDGTLWGWGNSSNTTYLLPYGSSFGGPLSSTPVEVYGGGTNWKQIALQTHTHMSETDAYSGEWYKHAAAIKTDGTLWTWGYNAYKQLGVNTTSSRISTPVEVHGGGTNWKQVSVGLRVTMAVKTDGTLWAWGNIQDNAFHYNDIANDKIISGNHTTPVQLSGSDWLSVYVGPSRYMAMKTDGTLYQWGVHPKKQSYGTNRWSGYSSTAETPYGFGVPSEVDVWGTNTVASNLPGKVENITGLNKWKYASTGGSGFSSIYGFTLHAAIKTDKTLWLWGVDRGPSYSYSQTFNYPFGIPFADYPTTTAEYRVKTPTEVFGGGEWDDVKIGKNAVLALKSNGTIWGWGKNPDGQLGVGDNNIRVTPTEISGGGTTWSKISMGTFHAAAVKTDGTLWTWGSNYNRQLGIIDSQSPDTSAVNSTSFTSTPLSVYTPTTIASSKTDWVDVACGEINTVALDSQGDVYVWGNKDFLGKFIDSRQLTPVQVDGTWKLPGSNPYDYGTFGVSMYDDGTNVQHPTGQVRGIKNDATLWVWGSNLGFPGNKQSTLSNTRLYTPTTTWIGGSDWRSVCIGPHATTAVKTDGTLWVWGNKLIGKSAYPSSTPITLLSGGTNWLQSTTGSSVSAAIKTDGTLWTWGSNNSLDNARVSTAYSLTYPFQVPGSWKYVEGGPGVTAGIKTNGTLWIWGISASGSALRGVIDVPAEYSKTVVTPKHVVTSFTWKTWGGPYYKKLISNRLGASIGINAIRNNGTLWGWGKSSRGNIGHYVPSTLPGETFTPVQVAGGGTTWSYLCEGDDNMGIKTDGTLWGWGSNEQGRLGVNSNLQVSQPTQPYGGGTWKCASSHYYGSPAVKTNGTLWCLGAVSSQLWVGGSSASFGKFCFTPIPYVGAFAGTDWDYATTPGGYWRFGGIKTNGAMYFWGINAYKGWALPNKPESSTSITAPYQVPGTWSQLSMGNQGGAAIKTNGTLWTWGNRYVRGDALAHFDSSTVIGEVYGGGTNWKQVSCNRGGFLGNPSSYNVLIQNISHMAAVKTDGTLWTWGYNQSGQLGTGDFTTRTTPVTTCLGGTDWDYVQCGQDMTWALKTNGTLYFWGTGAAEQGSNIPNTIVLWAPSSTNWNVTADTADASNWKQISLGNEHAVAVKDDGTLWAWGSNDDGRLGINLPEYAPNGFNIHNKSTPVEVYGGGTNWKQASAGIDYTLAVKTDGTLWAWGNNLWGQLGTGDSSSRSAPTQISGTNWVSCFATDGDTAPARRFSMGMKTDGTLWMWGGPGKSTYTPAFSKFVLNAAGTAYDPVGYDSVNYFDYEYSSGPMEFGSGTAGWVDITTPINGNATIDKISTASDGSSTFLMGNLNTTPTVYWYGSSSDSTFPQNIYTPVTISEYNTTKYRYWEFTKLDDIYTSYTGDFIKGTNIYGA